ncbi:MAG: DNA repair protein RadA [Syntrophales bacterium]|jgi:DNA repair protein RadA/Sms|nr:DNA repair protein RadA [Syntrophales bacterium]MCK9527787.1 DNA repair protein RadA [Syntrophales bacterium]MDX9922116.1 DNA repair protein RadA [Syntrophales bacterium]
MKNVKTVFYCRDCGHQSPKWLGKCPSCGVWNRFFEEEESRGDGGEGALARAFGSTPISIDAIEADGMDRLATGIDEFDRVLGGGLVKGSAVLIGGDPGIGKSTLLLQVLQNIAASTGCRVLYISGEESSHQIRMRGSRVGALSPNLMILVEVSLEAILRQIDAVQPTVVVIDSIQTMHSHACYSAPGSVSQVRETSEKLIVRSKTTGIPLFLVGHVTKDGAIAGPRVLEHMVDTVLYFEGDSGQAFRIIRAVKNRFGPTNEIGVFEMREEGLLEVANPSALFLSERPEGAAGSAVTACMEGTRPILLEVQSLVSENSFGIPRRTTIGVDHNRVSLLAAVLDRVCGFRLVGYDIFINVAGGVKVTEPAVDLAVVSSLLSSYLKRPLEPRTIVFGEVGLTGEIRGVGQVAERVREAGRMGFSRCILPRSVSVMRPADRKTVTTTGLGTIEELPEHLFEKAP